MPDMTSASPLVMTHFELISFVSACTALVLAIALDHWRARRGRAAGQRRR